MLESIVSGYTPYLVAAGAAVLGFVALIFKSKGKHMAINEANQEATDREVRGRDAVSKEQIESTGISAGDAIERMRRCDGDFVGL